MMLAWREEPRTDAALLALVAQLTQRVIDLERRLADAEEFIEQVAGDMVDRTTDAA